MILFIAPEGPDRSMEAERFRNVASYISNKGSIKMLLSAALVNP